MIKTRIYLAAMITVTAICGINVANMLRQPTPAEVVAGDVVEACQKLQHSAFLASLGGMKADSPCGKVLGL